MTSPTIGVLRRSAHGMPIEEYVTALRNRLPDKQVLHAKTPAEERSVVAECEVVTGLVLDDDLLDHAESMRLFACAYAGVNHLPLTELAERNVAVTSASGVHGPNVAEHVIGAILSFVRNFEQARHRQHRREWRHFRVDELKGSTVTVVGLGPIGTAILHRLEGFGVDRIGARYTPEKGGPAENVIDLTDDTSLHDALARTDHLVLSCPLTDVTRGLIGSDELQTLAPTATLVNVARGPVVDTEALVAALRSNALSGAALDVTDPEPLPADHPLWRLENVLITPHNAGHTPDYYERVADIVAENVTRIDESGSYTELKNQTLG